MNQAQVKITMYEVSVLPEGHRGRGAYVLKVEYRGDDRWAVTKNRFCLNSAGEWSYEMAPTDREDEWLAEHRFDFDTAMRLAAEAVHLVVVNGLTVHELLAMEQQHAQR